MDITSTLIQLAAGILGAYLGTRIALRYYLREHHEPMLIDLGLIDTRQRPRGCRFVYNKTGDGVVCGRPQEEHGVGTFGIYSHEFE